MNDTTALCLLEVYGLTSAIAVADAMAKGAPVVLLPRQQIGDGLVTVVARGGVSAVLEAVDAGRRVATERASLRSAAVLGRPADGIEQLFFPDLVATPGRGGAAPPVRARKSTGVDRIRARRTPPAHSEKAGGTQDV